MHGESQGVARGEDPCGADVDFLVELIGKDDRDVVSAVVLGRERDAVVEAHALAVELVHGAAPCIANPTCEFAYAALHQEFHAVGPTVTEDDHVLPIVWGTEQCHAVFVFQEIFHVLVVALNGEVGDAAPTVEEPQGSLMSLHGRYVVCDR